MISAFQNLSVRTKVIAAFAMVMAITIGLGVFGITRIVAIDDQLDAVSNNWLPSTRYLGEIKYQATRLRQRQASFLLETDSGIRAAEGRKIAATAVAVAAAQAKYDPFITAGHERSLADAYQRKWAAYLTVQDQLESVLGSRGQAAATALYIGPARTAFEDYLAAVDADLDYQSAGSTEARNDGQATYRSARVLIIVAMGLGLLLCLAAGFALVRAISVPLSKLTGVLGRLSTGDLSAEVDASGRKDEIGQVAAATVSLRDQLAQAAKDRARQDEITDTGIAVLGGGLEALAQGDLNHRIAKPVEGSFVKLRDDFNSAVGRLQEAMKTVVSSYEAIGKSQAVIEFNMDGTVISANENFLAALGYSAGEIVGKHHSMFVDPQFARSADYRQFWERLNRGEYVADKFKRIGNGGREVWIQASYNPLLDQHGKPFKVVKFATDITAAENESNELKAKIAAIGRAQAVIEFDLNGNILAANENFLATMGYSAAEIVGRHHSMFVEPDYARSGDYRQFWERLNRGEYVADKFRRVGRGGKEIWIQASYNPLLDLNGKPFKVVKFATDVTAIENERRAAEAERAAKAAEQAQVVSGLAAGLKDLSGGNLTRRLNQAFPGEYEQLRQDFNLTLERLQETMQTVMSSASGISTGAGEISQAADDLSKRTEQQAASLEETAAALEEITATVKKTAQNAKDASTIVTNAKSAAEEGGRVVETAIQAMGQIEQSSKQITDIIGVIDEIAFQTNLLALNAGVEAARAGDAGKGFAVVASEVRALAQRSSEAARQIKTLIKTSGEQVQSGVRLVDESGESLKRIVDQVVEINTLVGEMALAAQQQSTGIEEVNVAVSQMDQVTQQNAAMVEQSTAASRNLATETNELSRLVSFFQVSDRPAAAPAAAGPAAATAGRAVPRTVPKPAQRLASAGGGRRAVAAPHIDEDSWQEF